MEEQRPRASHALRSPESGLIESPAGKGGAPRCAGCDGGTVAGQLYLSGSRLFLGDVAARIDLKAYLRAVLRRSAGVHLGSGRVANTSRLLAASGRAANTSRLRLLAGSGRAAHLLAA